MQTFLHHSQVGSLVSFHNFIDQLQSPLINLNCYPRIATIQPLDDNISIPSLHILSSPVES